jgi:hypothetical protein
MDRDYWHQQKPGEPLFPDLLWSRPENKAFAGKLLIVGGNAHGFAAPAEAVGESEKAGIGTTRVLLPESVRKLLPPGFFEMEFAPATSSGSFARQAIADLLDASLWADGVLLAGDFSKNSETAIMLEQYIEKFTGLLTLTKDAVDLTLPTPQLLLDRPETLLVLSFTQLQKFGIAAGSATPFTSDMGLLKLVDTLHEFTAQHLVNIIVRYEDTFVVASGGQVSTTKQPKPTKTWCTRAAAHATTWWLQSPSKAFEALTSGIYEIS